MDSQRESSIYEEEFILLKTMPTSRLNDIVTNMDKRKVKVVNLDACIPPREAGEIVLRTILFKMPETINVLS